MVTLTLTQPEFYTVTLGLMFFIFLSNTSRDCQLQQWCSFKTNIHTTQRMIGSEPGTLTKVSKWTENIYLVFCCLILLKLAKENLYKISSCGHILRCKQKLKYSFHHHHTTTNNNSNNHIMNNSNKSVNNRMARRKEKDNLRSKSAVLRTDFENRDSMHFTKTICFGINLSLHHSIRPSVTVVYKLYNTESQHLLAK